MSKRPPKYGVKVTPVHTLVVDGNALFKTGFFGAKDMYNHNGQHIGGIYQFLTVLRKVLDEGTYHRVYVFWDGKFSGLLRYQIYPDYKIDRGKDYVNGTQPQDESELSQRVAIQRYLSQLNIRQLQHEIVEGDDFVAYYCLCRKEHEHITIISNDRDMCQLIEPGVRIYFCDLKQYVADTNYSEYFSHNKQNSALIKTITGDNSDSIKGIKGVKEPTLLSIFPDLKTKPMTIQEIVTQAQTLQTQRLEAKKKPLQALTNIIECVTDGVQGKRLYEINAALVDLKRPMLTEDAVRALELLMDGEFKSEADFKNVLILMKRDGLEQAIGQSRYPEYLLPFKKLIQREKSNPIL